MECLNALVGFQLPVLNLAVQRKRNSAVGWCRVWCASAATPSSNFLLRGTFHGNGLKDVAAMAINRTRLLDLGQTDFIEIKGVTYCGSTATSSLTMENVPWHEDVKAFAEAIAAERGGAEYELACELSHSCCVLLAKSSKFKVNGKWHTWIDYEKFQDLIASGKPFDSEDYMALTPSWSVYDAAEGGFDPHETRVKKERRHGSADPGGCT